MGSWNNDPRWDKVGGVKYFRDNQNEKGTNINQKQKLGWVGKFVQYGIC